jgi:exodeoxyribonuclease VII large subunit
MIAGAGARHVVTVSELARSLQASLDRSHRDVWVAGELSNVRAAASGHVYFVLKDDAAQVAGVAFRTVAARVGFRLVDGLEVVVGGRVGLYPARGALQLYADRIEPLGAGALALAFEELKARLGAEGLFAPARKRPLPRFPAVVGVVTSRHGAAIRDVCRVLRDRWPIARVVVAGTVVQGADAGPDVARAVAALGRRGDVDVLLVVRGGGSLEDLWAFNTEIVARAMAACPVPTVSGVGHEHDVTIADLVADVRASTPTAAAACAVPDRRAVAAAVRERAVRLSDGLRRRVVHEGLRVRALARGLGNPRRRLEEIRLRVDELAERLRAGLARRTPWEGRLLRGLAVRLEVAALRGVTAPTRARLAVLDARLRHGIASRAGDARSRLATSAAKLDVLSPLASLDRGYAIVRRPDTGAVVRDAGRLAVGDPLEVLLRRGRARVRVERREET